jgi:RND family efflux transporter MFP subunit
MMTRTRSLGLLLAALGLAGLSLLVGFRWGRAQGGPEAEQEGAAKEGPIASVQVVPMQKGRLAGEVTAFGSIVPAPGAAQSVAVAYECRVAAIAVREGQVVAAGTPLLTVTDSPDSALAWEQARIDLRAAEAALQQVRGRHAVKLADNGQLAAAQQGLDTAQAKVKNLEARRGGAPQVLRAQAAGVVVRLPAPVGAVVPAGGTLVEWVDTARLEARLGVEPQEAMGVHAGDALTLAAVEGDAAAAMPAKLRAVSPAINPATRLRDLFVPLPSDHGFALGQYVCGHLATASREGLIVPYAAVLPMEGTSVLFTVRQGHALRHPVRVLLQNGDRLLVTGEGLSGDDPVIVQGQSVVQDGMAVQLGPRP